MAASRRLDHIEQLFGAKSGSYAEYVQTIDRSGPRTPARRVSPAEKIQKLTQRTRTPADLRRSALARSQVQEQNQLALSRVRAPEKTDDELVMELN